LFLVFSVVLFRCMSPQAAASSVVWRLLDHDPENRLVAVVLAVAGVAGALILLRMRVRLAADARGITIVGPLHARTVAWSQIVTISTPRRGRFGRRGASLEIDVRSEPPEDRLRGDAGYDAKYDAGYDAALGGSAAGGPDPDLDTELLAFGAFELGTDPAAVGRALTRLRP
jgi:hypothetical protein